jgi:hypothetical protein
LNLQIEVHNQSSVQQLCIFPEFVLLHGEDKIRYYTGIAKIGRITNAKEFFKIKNSKEILIFEDVKFL